MAASPSVPSTSSTSFSGGSTSSSVYGTSEEKTNGTKLARLLIDVGTHVLKKFLDSVYPPPALAIVLKNNNARFKYLKSKHLIFDYQWEMLFPSSGDPPDSKTFDITLLHLLIREVCKIPAPSTGWHKMPAEDDESLEANITRIKCFRNELCHSVSTGIATDEFEDKWNNIASSLEAIEICAFQKKIEGLKDDRIDHGTQQSVEDQVEKWRKFQEQEELEPISQLSSYLPDMLPQKRMFGRSQELQQVREYVESGTVSVVLITGGPGFGKTTVANAVAHDLAKQNDRRTVLFCRLLSKKTFNDVATEMIHSCSEIHTQLPENPAQWLNDWSKQIQKPVTFVLDNADGVLETAEDRDSFLKILSKMRKDSKQQVTFVITSRKTFKHSDLLSVAVVRLEPVSPEEAKKILVSRVNDENIRKKLSKTEKIVALCGRVPLALCIVGSLLSDYTEEKLIKHLEDEPMAVLEDDGESVQASIKTSFDLLTKAEHDALILMSTFPGSFNCDAAEVVIKACSDSGTLPFSILRSLKNRSLVEQPSSRRCQLHPLIRAFGKKIGQNDPHLLDVGTKLACAHFMSRLNGNANMFWGMDTCKESIESFNKDRPNFEYFLQVYCQGMANHDQEIVDSCKGFLEALPQKCMYLEKCVKPKFYIEILEGLLKSFDRKIQPVHVVELLCLLGHEMRKERKNENYTDYMEQATQLYKNTEFNTMALSEVYYLNSCAQFLSTVKKEYKPVKSMYDTALQICEKNLPDHPEKATTLLFAGRNAKNRKDNDKALEMYKQALVLCRKRLGDHFMTALCLKEIADFYLLFSKTDVDSLSQSLLHYKEALRVMENLAEDYQKESILMLKNYGVCQQRNGNFEKAISLLQRAERVATREIKGDHMWKVMVKTEQAILYHEEAIKEGIESSTRKSLEDQMEASMKEGLLMCYSVGDRTIGQLSSKHLIRKILADYPKRFPEKQYPRQ